MSLLEVHGLTKTFGSTIAVEDIAFSLQEREIYGLIGPNGSGKTTIVKMLVGLYEPTAGKVFVDNRDRFAVPEEINALVGYIPDNPFVYEYMAGSEYLDFVAALHGLEQAPYKERLRELFAFMPIEEILSEPMEAYSRGNKQKLMIVAALLHRPRLLIIDEPVVGLDLESTRHLRQLLEEFRFAGGSVFMTTHTLAFLEPLVDRIGLLSDGHLIAEGSLHSLRERAGVGPEASLDDVYTQLTSVGHGMASV